jgi:hypothetical protein
MQLAGWTGNEGIRRLWRKRYILRIIMVKLIIEPKKAKDGQVEFTVNYQDPKTDNSFTITITNSLDEAIGRLKTTLEAEVQAMMQKK